MPSALETMVKILKLEREQGGKNTAVIGGLAAFAASWQADARAQARRPQHQILIDEIVDALAQYERIKEADQRLTQLNYLLDRATNRKPPPKAYRDRLPEWESKMGGKQKRGASRREKLDEQAPAKRRRGAGSRARQGKNQPYAGVSWDEDFAGLPAASQPKLDLPPLPRLSRPPRQPLPQVSSEERQALLEALEAPTTAVKGIGKKFGELLQAQNIHTVRQLLFARPRVYRDYTEQTCIKDLQPGERATVIASIIAVSVIASARGGKDIIVRVADGTGRMSLRFFGQSFLAARLRKGMQLVFQGKVNFFRDMPQVANPEWEELDIENLHTRGIVPVYRMTKGLRPRLYRRTLKMLVGEWAGRMPDPIPPPVLERTELANLGWALQQAHFPLGWDHLRHAKKRLKFDELLFHQLAMLARRRAWQSLPAAPLAIDEKDFAGIVDEIFPFDFTDGQKSAIADIRGDMAGRQPMNRLLQGDVGSGKTAVAIAALAIAYAEGKQAALMAPTGILAQQHLQVVSDAFSRLARADKPVIALLTSALSTSERESIYRGISDGSIDIVIGTHALIQKKLEFADLGLAIIDEQQRFGVDQRANLRGKGQNPHLLVMTATPIPRTLALTLHADLDISVMRDKPAGRQTVTTKIIDPVARERLNGFVLNQLEGGRQAFFVHPLVEESHTIETASALEAYERLKKVFFRYRVCLLHGRMSAEEKDALMADFAARKYDVMVTTAVAEVGVDIPNANIMVIDGANRYGLAQLHQFRGRVGRGQHQSYCFLLPDTSAAVNIDRIRAAQAGANDSSALSIAEQRLSALEMTTDGFELAELDWRLRGAGDLLGRRQSGSSQLELMEALSPELLAEAQREARTIYEEDPELALPQHQLLAGRVQARLRETTDIS